MERAVRQSAGRGGFTLIEVMISVLVLSIALSASISLLAQYSDMQGRIERRYIGHLVAWNEVVRGFSYTEMVQDKKGSAAPQGRVVDFGEGRWRVSVDSERLAETSMRLYEVRVLSQGEYSQSALLKAYLSR